MSNLQTYESKPVKPETQGEGKLTYEQLEQAYQDAVARCQELDTELAKAPTVSATPGSIDLLREIKIVIDERDQYRRLLDDITSADETAASYQKAVAERNVALVQLRAYREHVLGIMQAFINPNYSAMERNRMATNEVVKLTEALGK